MDPAIGRILILSTQAAKIVFTAQRPSISAKTHSRYELYDGICEEEYTNTLPGLIIRKSQSLLEPDKYLNGQPMMPKSLNSLAHYRRKASYNPE